MWTGASTRCRRGGAVPSGIVIPPPRKDGQALSVTGQTVPFRHQVAHRGARGQDRRFGPAHVVGGFGGVAFGQRIHDLVDKGEGGGSAVVIRSRKRDRTQEKAFVGGVAAKDQRNVAEFLEM